METVAIPVDVYLHETWSPDREYVDGEVVERAMGELDHAAWQGALLRYLSAYRRTADISVYPELRLQVKPSRYRIPDIMVIPRDAPHEQIITHPPLLCVEILSPEDRITRIEEKLQDYFEMGVRSVWVIDPRTQIAYLCSGALIGQWQATETLTVSGTPIRVELRDLIADLD